MGVRRTHLPAQTFDLVGNLDNVVQPIILRVVVRIHNPNS